MLKDKIEQTIFKAMKPILESILIAEFPNLDFDKIIYFWIDLMNKLFKIITALSLTLAFIWFFPSLGVKSDKLIIILLCAILLQLRNRNE